MFTHVLIVLSKCCWSKVITSAIVQAQPDFKCGHMQCHGSSTRKGCLERLGEADENAYISDVIGQTVPKFYVDVLTSLLYSHTNF